VSLGKAVYCIDSSSLIACRRVYPIDVFPGLWQNLSDLIADGRLISPEEVWHEIDQGTDELTDWARTHQGLFVPPDQTQIAFVAQIAQDYSLATQPTIAELRADPWVVALAQARYCTVVSEEGGISQPIPKIPQMCARYSLPHTKIVQLMKAEGWTFS